MAYLYVFYALFAMCCGYALVRGGAPERLVAMLLVGSWLITQLTFSPVPHRFQHLELGALTVDIVLFAMLFTIAVASRRLWPIPMAALQLVQVLSHLAPVVMTVSGRLVRNASMGGWIYGLATALPSYVMLLLLAAATWRHRRRRTMLGADAPWKVSSHR